METADPGQTKGTVIDSENWTGNAEDRAQPYQLLPTDIEAMHRYNDARARVIFVPIILIGIFALVFVGVRHLVRYFGL